MVLTACPGPGYDFPSSYENSAFQLPQGREKDSHHGESSKGKGKAFRDKVKDKKPRVKRADKDRAKREPEEEVMEPFYCPSAGPGPSHEDTTTPNPYDTSSMNLLPSASGALADKGDERLEATWTSAAYGAQSTLGQCVLSAFPQFTSHGIKF
jgi:hypothetical protein